MKEQIIKLSLFDQGVELWHGHMTELEQITYNWLMYAEPLKAKGTEA